MLHGDQHSAGFAVEERGVGLVNGVEESEQVSEEQSQV